MNERMKAKDYFFLLIVTIAIIGIFTLIDYYVHGLSEEYYVPGYYYKNKMIYGSLIGYIALLIARKWKLWKRVLFMSVVVSGLLQTRYYLEGYSRKFVFEFMLLHFLMMIIASLLILFFYDKFSRRIFLRNNER